MAREEGFAVKNKIILALACAAGVVLAQPATAPMPQAQVEAAAAGGAAEAQFELGSRYLRGAGVPRDPKTGLDWLERAARQGHVKAMVVLGIFYRSGALGTPDFARARSHLTEAAGLGSAEASSLLGLMAMNGQGLPAPDAEAAEKHLREGLERGDRIAVPALAMLLMGTNAQPGRAPAEGIALLRRTAMAGNATAAHTLYLVYAGGANTVARDEREAARWLAVAAKAGLPESQAAMAVALRNGQLGLGREPREAYFWISLAAQKMHPAAVIARGEFEKELTPNEIAEVQQQLRNWKPVALAARSGRVPLDQLRIGQRFDTLQVTRENFPAAVRACLAGFGDAAVERVVRDWNFPRRNATTRFTHETSAGSFVIHEDTGFCIQESEAGFPVLAGEALLATVNPAGVPEAVRDEWLASIAKLVATKGYAEVVFQFSNGNGFTTVFRPTPDGTRIQYRTSFRKAGEYDPSKYDAVFTHPSMNSVTSNSYNNRTEKFVLLHRFQKTGPLPAQ